MVEQNKSRPHKPSLEASLIKAAREGYYQRVETLVKAGANLEAKDPKWGGTALMWAAEGNHHDCVYILLKAGAKVDTQDRHGETALMWGAGVASTSGVDILLTYDADVHIRDNHGRTALDHVKRYLHEIDPLSRDARHCWGSIRLQTDGPKPPPLRLRNDKIVRPGLD